MNLIITTTENTFLDAVNYAGFEPSKTKIVSELIDFDWLQDATKLPKNERYIHWATNATPHKNHKRIISALKEVLEIYQDFCVIVTGVETEKFITSSINRNSYTKEISSQIYEAGLEKKIIFKGNLEPSEYKKILINAQLHLQSSLYDNGSFTPLEATKVNVPSVYGRYPQMVELARTHNVNGLAANPYDEKDIKIKILNILGNEYLLKTKQIDQHEILESNKLLLTILESTD
jgi:glycosyltransferase involved in cell wall biosynthesis